MAKDKVRNTDGTKSGEAPTLATCKLELEIKDQADHIPLVGWHANHATIEWQGETWELVIAGGCQSIWLSRSDDKGGRDMRVSVSIADIAQAMLETVCPDRDEVAK